METLKIPITMEKSESNIPSSEIVEDVHSTNFQPEDDAVHKPISKAEQRLVLKIDLVVLPFAALIYLVAYLVRS